VKISNDLQNRNPELAVVEQVCSLIGDTLEMKIEKGADGLSFQGSGRSISSVSGVVSNDSLDLRFILVRVEGGLSVRADFLFERLSELESLGGKYRLIFETDGGAKCLGVGFGISTVPLTLPRLAHIRDEIERLKRLGALLKEGLPEILDDRSIRARYDSVSDVLAPVLPLNGCVIPESVLPLAERILECQSAAIPVALIAPNPLRERYLLSCVASLCAEIGLTLGVVEKGLVPVRQLPDLLSKAPGGVAAPMESLFVRDSENYDMGSHLRTLWASTRKMKNGLIITGSEGELQHALNGGQGQVSDPLEPLILRADYKLEFGNLLDFAIDTVARDLGGLSAAEKREVRSRIGACLAPQQEDVRERLLLAAVRREVMLQKSGRTNVRSLDEFVLKMRDSRETFTGSTGIVIPRRSDSAQRKLVEVFCDKDFENRLKTRILGQSCAVRGLVQRLRNEALCRPPEQPLRVLLEGSPATGKSESAKFIAEALGFEHMTVDCAGIPDYYTFSAQLLGSGRGIVMSHQPGRLEIAARKGGVVMEIADLDHAPPTVRAAIADLFLQCMETGLGQSSAGGNFNTCNIILAFTINLPGRRDEAAHNGFGYRASPDPDAEAEERVIREALSLFSPAFLSRVGTPILFKPLDGEALRGIVAAALAAALKAAAGNTGHAVPDVAVDNSAVDLIVSRSDRKIMSFGARMLLEQARSHAAEAYLEFMPSASLHRSVRVVRDGNRLSILPS